MSKPMEEFTVREQKAFLVIARKVLCNPKMFNEFGEALGLSDKRMFEIREKVIAAVDADLFMHDHFTELQSST